MGTSVDPKESLFPQNIVPSEDELPVGFMDYLWQFVVRFGPEQERLLQRRRSVLADAHAGRLPDYLPSNPDSPAYGNWYDELPEWCQDQRNQITLPADDAKMIVAAYNGGSPGEMIDLEDSMANYWPNLKAGVANARAALLGELTYEKDSRTTLMDPNGKTVLFTRVRGLHMHQHFAFTDRVVPAGLFDLALLTYQLDFEALKHPLSIYIPKSESAEEAIWWRELLREVAVANNQHPHAIKCMALVESHPLAYQAEEFLYNLRDHILGLNLGRYDKLASDGHFLMADPGWVLPDPRSIPHDLQSFQNVRHRMVEICHKHGKLAIGGMTALFPNRKDAACNERALSVLEHDKRNEAALGMDGAWTGHPDQNEIAVAQFPFPNQVHVRYAQLPTSLDLRPSPSGTGKTTIEGTRDAIRTIILYRAGVLAGKGASLIDGRMEDLATERINRVAISQRILHGVAVPADDLWKEVSGLDTFVHDRENVKDLYFQETTKLLGALPPLGSAAEFERIREAARISQQMIFGGVFDPT